MADAAAKQQASAVAPMVEDDGDAPAADGYVPPPPVDLAALAARTEADAALQRYKESLVGSAATAGVSSPASADPETRPVVVREIRVLVDGRPDVVLRVGTPDEVAATAAAPPLVFKEGATYRLRFVFTVHRDVVLGLRFANVVSRLGVPVDRDALVVGAYAPRGADAPYDFTTPPAEWPAGLLARGGYTSKTRFTDDDGRTHLALAWAFRIERAWPDEK
jgi:Rho GDP-dissociation inhibitor